MKDASSRSKYFPPISKWHLPQAVLPMSLKELAYDGVMGNEGVVLWLGQRRNGIATITHLVGLRGQSVIKQPDFLHIEASLFNEIADLAIELGITLLGQIHSHGRWFGTDLSPTDRALGIATPYYLSIVAPDFGLRSRLQLADCGIHIFEPGHGFRRLSNEEVRRQVEVTPVPPPSLLILGNNR